MSSLNSNSIHAFQVAKWTVNNNRRVEEEVFARIPQKYWPLTPEAKTSSDGSQLGSKIDRSANEAIDTRSEQTSFYNSEVMGRLMQNIVGMLLDWCSWTEQKMFQFV